MKILHVNTNDTGGAAIAAIRLHYLLLDKGIDSRILFLKRSGRVQIREAYYFEDQFSGKAYFKCLLFLNSAYNRRFTFSKPDIYFNGPDSLFDLSKHTLFKEADVVHLHWVIKFLDWKNVFVHTPKKFVWTLHDMNPFTGGEHYQTGYNNEFPAVSRKNIAKKIKCSASANLHVVTPSEWMGELARQSEVFKNKPVTTVRNPINTDLFNIRINTVRQRYQIPADKRIILFVAENPGDQRKGFKLLLEAFQKLKDHQGLHLLIIGNAAQVNISNFSYTLAGSIYDEELMADIYNAADLFIIPSIEDNLPNTVSESLLCGTPVTGFRIGGIAEMVKDGINGSLAENANTLHHAIETALASSYSREAIRQDALMSLNTETIFAELKTIYG